MTRGAVICCIPEAGGTFCSADAAVAGLTEKANHYYKLFINWTNEKIKKTFVKRYASATFLGGAPAYADDWQASRSI